MGIIGIFAVFMSITWVYSSYYAPLSANSYEIEIYSIFNEFRQITEEDARYYGTSQAKSTAEVEKQLKTMIDKLDSLKKRGFPVQYNEFHEHYTNNLENYLKWRSFRWRDANSSEEYFNSSMKEEKLAFELYTKVKLQ